MINVAPTEKTTENSISISKHNTVETPNLEAHTPEVPLKQLSKRLETLGNMPFADVSNHYLTKMSRDEYMSTPTVGLRQKVESVKSGSFDAKISRASKENLSDVMNNPPVAGSIVSSRRDAKGPSIASR